MVQLMCSWFLAHRGDIEHFRVRDSSIEAHEMEFHRVGEVFLYDEVDRHIRIAWGYSQLQIPFSVLHKERDINLPLDKWAIYSHFSICHNSFL